MGSTNHKPRLLSWSKVGWRVGLLDTFRHCYEKICFCIGFMRTLHPKVFRKDLKANADWSNIIKAHQ